jgi:hypothetical protein
MLFEKHSFLVFGGWGEFFIFYLYLLTLQEFLSRVEQKLQMEAKAREFFSEVFQKIDSYSIEKSIFLEYSFLEKNTMV